MPESIKIADFSGLSPLPGTEWSAPAVVGAVSTLWAVLVGPSGVRDAAVAEELALPGPGVGLRHSVP